MKILLACSSGMSTSLVVNKLKKESADRNRDDKIWAVGQTELEKAMEECDVLLIAPQMRMIKAKIEPKAKELNVLIDVIAPEVYGKIDVVTIMDMAINLSSKEDKEENKSGWFSKIEKPLMAFGDKINNILFFNVLRDAFMVAFPVIIFGSIVTIIANFPFLSNILGEETAKNWANLLAPASNASMNIMAMFVCCGIGYFFAKAKKCEGIFCAVVCLSAFFILFPWELIAPEDAEEPTSYAAITFMGAKGMFVAIIISFLMSWIYCFVFNKKIQIKMPDTVPPAVAKSFAALIPASISLLFALILQIIFVFLPYSDIFDFVYKVVQTPLISLGSGLAASIIAIFFVQFFWFFGLQGQVLVNSVMDPIWNVLMIENLTNYTSGNEVANIVTKPFMEVFTVGLGGSGATLIVVIMLVFIVRSKQLKNLGKIALPAGIFNVNEPFIFGLPIILNPLVVIPWLVAPMVSVTVAYLAMQFGFVPLTTGVAVPWTTPIFLSGFLATNSWQGAVLQLVQVVVVGAIWLPFVKMIDKKYFKREKNDKVQVSK